MDVVARSWWKGKLCIRIILRYISLKMLNYTHPHLFLMKSTWSSEQIDKRTDWPTSPSLVAITKCRFIILDFLQDGLEQWLVINHKSQLILWPNWAESCLFCFNEKQRRYIECKKGESWDNINEKKWKEEERKIWERRRIGLRNKFGLLCLFYCYVSVFEPNLKP